MKPHILKKSLVISLWDGVFSSCMLGLTAEYITPYALALKANLSQIGLLTAAQNLAVAVAYFFAPDLTEKVGSRKKIVTRFVFLQACMGIPIILIPYLFRSHQIAALIVFVSLFAACNAIATPAWMSMMSDHLPRARRGRYFGWRNKVLGAVQIFFLFVAGLVLHIFRLNVLKGFLIVFSIAAASRFASWHFLTRMHEPKRHVPHDAYFSLSDFVRRAPSSNFAQFVFFVSGLTFSVNLAAPFFSVFMLRDLRFNYLTYTVLITLVSVATFFTIQRWGKLADKVGNLKVVRSTAFFIASLPFFWVIYRHPVFLGLIQIISGIAWAGFNLCAINFIYDAVTPAKRTRCSAYYTFFTGLSIFLGALTGGFLGRHLPPLFGYKLLTLFLLSGTARFLIILFFSRRIREVRTVEHMPTHEVFYSVLGLRSMQE
ncbi:MAG TPA: MFS transporter [Candidatus Omnitrophota bacterium]|nr:MFS transporter [Candidatus Omnitrophota bacterium]